MSLECQFVTLVSVCQLSISVSHALQCVTRVSVCHLCVSVSVECQCVNFVSMCRMRGSVSLECKCVTTLSVYHMRGSVSLYCQCVTRLSVGSQLLTELFFTHFLRPLENGRKNSSNTKIHKLNILFTHTKHKNK